MKHSIKGLFVILAIVMSFVLVQGVWAYEITATGTIVRIGTGSIDVDVNEEGISTFYHIPFTNEDISLEMDDLVTISAYVVTFPNGKIKYIAYSLKVVVEGKEITYSWHPNLPKAGTTDLDSARAVSYDDDDCVCNGDCICDKCPDPAEYPNAACDCLCECICAGDGPNGPKGPKN
jgi:hypothetical protein